MQNTNSVFLNDYSHLQKIQANKSIRIAIVLLLIIFSGCKTEEKQGYICNNGVCQIGDNPQYQTYTDCQSACAVSNNFIGYKCASGNCIAVTENPQYSTLTDCQALCSGISPGYNCSNGNCVSVINGAQFSSLSACQSACVAGNFGTLVITATWTTFYGVCDPAFNVKFGFGNTLADINNDNFFWQSGLYQFAPANYTYTLFAPGTYYYKAKKTYNTAVCDTTQGIPATVNKTGIFTITTGQTTAVSVGSLD